MRTLQLILVAFLLSISLNAQDYIPMLQDDNEWSFDFNCFSTDGPCITSYKCTIIGTLTVDGVVYQNLLIEDYLGNTNYTCLLREDQGIVYYYNDSMAMEEVMLDFTLEVGDTFDFSSHCFLNPIGGTFTVEEIDIEFIAGENRKVLRLKEQGVNLDEFWIEGIGSTFGIGPGYGGPDSYTLLSCFEKNGEITFFNEAPMCDNTFLSLDENSLTKLALIPNPVVDVSILKLPFIDEGSSFKIFDITGKLVEKKPIINKSVTIYNSDYPSGLYLYQVQVREGLIYSDKLIIQ